MDVYRDSPALSAIRQRLLEVNSARPISRHAGSDPNEAGLIALRPDGSQKLLDLANQLLAANTSLESAVILDAIKIIAQLHTDAVDEALAGVDCMLEVRNYADYVLLSLHEALKKVGRELHKVINLDAFSSVRPRLQSALDRVMQRYNELSDAAGPNSVAQQ